MTSHYRTQAARLSHKSFLLATVATLVGAAFPTLAIAQEAPANPAPSQPTTAPSQPVAAANPDDIVITGFRKSLSAARDIKKKSVIEVDAIVADDIAKFPELNLAESLQRIPGVQITREAGEGRRISLRGLGPDFARVQLNGMEVLGNVDSAQDSRGQRSRDRAFDFNIFASELFSKAEVEKTYQVSQTEGGMAGTVGLFTGKPFDYGEGTKFAITGKLGTNQYTKDAEPRIVALLSRNWDNEFGVAFSVSYGERRTDEEGHNTYNYTNPSNSDFTGPGGLLANGLDISHLSAAQQSEVVSGNLYFPDGNRLSSWQAKLQRLGLTGAVQWRPASNLLMTLDVLHSEFTTHRDEYHLATRPLNGYGSIAIDGAIGSPWPAVFNQASVINSIAYDSSGYVNYINVTNATFGSEHRRELNENHFTQAVLTPKWDASDRLTIDGHVGYEKSDYVTPYDDKLYMRAKGGLIADYGADGRSASFQYPGWNPADPSNWTMDDFYYRAFNNGSKLWEGVLNLHYKINDVLTFRAGGAYHRFSQDGVDYFYDGSENNGTNGETQGTSVNDISDIFSNSFGSWVVGDFDKAFAKYHEYHRLGPKPDGTGAPLQDIEQDFSVTESTFAGFAQMDWDSSLFGKHFRGNIGLRGYHTNTESVGRVEQSVPGNNYAYFGTADVKGHYSGVLPALNTVLELTPEVQARFAATQNLNRPTLGDLAAKGSASDNSGNIQVSLGNPNLKPFKDTTLDFSLEYYFGKIGLVSASLFQKWVKNFITSSSTLEPLSQTGLTLSGVPGSTLVPVSQPINEVGTHPITGIEVIAQRQFNFLPKPFDNIGVTANFTYIHLDQNYFTGISKTNYNITVYYETNKYGARASVSHRSRWYASTDPTPSPMDTGITGYEPSTYVDAAAFWNITKRFQLTLDAVNLTNQTDTEFWGQNRYLYNQTQSGTTVLAGFALKF